jgi:hypothetical protein
MDFTLTLPFNHQRTIGRIHDYTQRIQGKEYVLDAVADNDCEKLYMTSQSKGIKPKDYILLSRGGSAVRYVIEQIDYYCDRSGMWIALLASR